jgi:hypothetical protein
MRYVIRPRAVHQDPPYDDEAALIPHLEVDGPREVDTGLVSECGHPIMRLADPIGFGREDER